MKASAPYFLKLILPQLIWQIKTEKKEIYLTFDDGPHPEITKKVMDILDEYGAKATFFCVGHNVEKFPETYSEILNRGHKTGNHTYNHLNGWKVKRKEYFENIEKCAILVDSHLYRPPYGRISLKHIPYLKMNFRIIMWSVLSMDYDNNISPEKCLRNSVNHAREGSIIVFHDSEKSSRNMFYALPRFLEHFKSKGYSFPVLTSESIG
jgi:peptidoglycan/xylan/chitin deacetylase (PgdA/CDA1 family)